MTSKNKPGFFAPHPTRQETVDAVLALDQELDAADLHSLSPTFDSNHLGLPHVRLNAINARTAVELARLLRKALRGPYKVAAQLGAAARAHGLDDFPDPTIYGAKIHLGEVSIATADRLACLLGAPTEPELELADTPDWPESQHVSDRLHTAFKHATDGGFMDQYVHTYCRRCDGEPAIELGALSVGTARRLVKALQRGVSS
ncbi:hypothetical protein ACO0M4_05910 [Streptomyces sp. RGM 3693]|uniref:hypothetical protein n=1 Tax=Streptomyces sp. RGM 3693 TaxID=3413284 RepID=UPI003D2E3F2F